MKSHKIRGIICRSAIKGVRFPHCITASALLLLLHCLAIPCIATELKQKTVDAFDHYVCDTEARMDAELRPGGPFLWVDSLPQPRRQHLYDLLQHGQFEIRQEKTEQEGKPIEIPDGLIHHWTVSCSCPGFPWSAPCRYCRITTTTGAPTNPTFAGRNFSNTRTTPSKSIYSFTGTPRVTFRSIPNSEFTTPGLILRTRSATWSLRESLSWSIQSNLIARSFPSARATAIFGV